jgi:hypothetical protein
MPHRFAPRRRSLFQWFIAAGALVAASLSVAQATRDPSPSIRILGFADVPSNTCTEPSVSVNVVANGTAQHSDTYAILVDGTPRYRWAEGETMAWATSSEPLPYGLTSDALTGSFPPNTVITGQIVTYSESNPAGPTFIAGNAVFLSQISWNCTTGQQVGEATNIDLRPREPVPVHGGAALAGLIAAIAGVALRRTNRRR